MTEDISVSTHIGIGLGVAALVLMTGLVVYGVTQNTKREETTKITNATAYAYDTDFDVFNDYKNQLPVASVFVTLTKDTRLIHKITGSLDGEPIASVGDLTSHFSSKAYVTTKLVGDKQYDINISN